MPTLSPWRVSRVLIFVLFPVLACMAGTMRHQVNPDLPGHDPEVTNLLPSPDGTRVYFMSDSGAESTIEWFWVPSAGGAATLLAQDGPSTDVQITPDGMYLVGRDSTDLVTVNTTTGAVVTIATAGIPDDILVSPDSSTVVFGVDGSLYAVAPTGGTPVEITPPVASGDYPIVDGVEFLPDSSAVVFASRPDILDDTVLYAYPLPLGSGSRVALSDTSAGYFHTFKVTPNSSRVVYIQDDGSFQTKVRSVLPDGTGRLTISDVITSNIRLNLAVSSDSTKVYFVDWFSGEVRSTSVTSNTDTNLITGGNIAPEIDDGLQLSPDDNTLVFLGTDNSVVDCPTRLYSLPVTAGTPVLINSPAGSEPIEESAFSKSFLITPNSQRVIYLCDNDASGTVDLMSGKIDGTGVARLDRDSLSGSDYDGFLHDGIDTVVHVLADSSHVIYAHDEVTADKTEVFAIHPNGTGRVKLNPAISADDSIRWLEFASDDSFLVYAADANGDGGSEPWVTTLPGFVDSQLVDMTDMGGSVEEMLAVTGEQTLFYTAYQDSADDLEVYAVPYTGGTPVKISHTLVPGHHLTYAFEANADASHITYQTWRSSTGYKSYHAAADGSGAALMEPSSVTRQQFKADGSGVYFLADHPGGSSWKMLFYQSFAGGARVQVSPTPLNVNDFELSSDGMTLVLLAAPTGSTNELYAMPAGGGAVVKISPALVTGGAVADFSITPDSATVVFNADAVTDSSYMLFAVPITGGSATVLDAAGGTGLRDVVSFALTPDGSKVVYSGNLDAPDDYGLYVIPLAGGTRVTLHAPMVADGDVEDFEINSTGTHVVYSADGDVDGTMELYGAKLDGTSTVKLNGTLVADGDVQAYDISADGTWLAYLADQNTDNTLELFHVAVTGGTVTRLHAGYSSTRDVISDFRVVGSDHVVFRADHGGGDNDMRLFCTKVPDFITNRLDTITLPNGDVSGFTVEENGAYIAYTADQTTEGEIDLHVVYGVPDVTPIANRVGLMNMPLGPVPFTVSDLESPAANLTVTAVSSNPTLLPNSGITLGGSGGSRQLFLTPNAGQWGATTVTVTVSDGVHEAQSSFEVKIIPDPNDPPTDISLSPPHVVENAPPGTFVGVLGAVDADAWDVHTYTLIGGATALFSVSGNHLVTNAVFDYETAISHNLQVRVTDFTGAFFDRWFTINIIDVSGKPVDFSRAGVMNQRFFLSDTEFHANFVLLDGPALERIRIETAPANGQLVLGFPEELIDGGISGPRSLAAADLNGDTRRDLVAAASSGGVHTLVWYEQAAAAPRFPMAGLHTIDTGAAIANINAVATADLNNDGRPDIVASCGAPTNTVFLYRNNGASPPVFIRSVLTTIPNNPVALAVGNIDGNPEPDIVVASSGDNTVRVYRRNGAAPFPAYHPVDLASTVEQGVSGIALEDLDKDGRLDIACADRTSGEIGWLRNNGAVPPVFARKVAATIAGTSSVVTGDYNKDGFMDLATASLSANRLDWLKNDGAVSPNFTLQPLAAVFAVPTSLASADLDGDGDPDVVATSATTNKVVAYENQGGSPPFFHALDIDRDCPGAACVLARDLDGDGKTDLAAGADTANDLSWYVNSRVLGAGAEVDIDEAQKLSYQPNFNFVGIDNFTWRGHDGVQWSINAGKTTFSVYGSEYWNWLIAHFTLPVVLDPAARAGTWGSAADADGDGVNNITEYALRGDPKDPADAPGLDVQVLPDAGLDYLFASYPFRKNETNLAYALEVSTDLASWNSGAAYFSHVPPDTALDAFFDTTTYKVLDDTSVHDAQFVRLRIVWALD